jgi:hypothetical protein
MRTLKLLTLGMFAACTAGAATAPIPAVPDFGWLAGHWCSKDHGELVEEHWLAPRGDLSLGLSRTVKSGKTTSFEFLRIELRDHVPHYVAQPGGAPPTAFRLTASGPGWARFEDPAHDFPQRVEYRRDGTDLHAAIAGPGAGGKELVIPFDYVPCTP